MSMHVIRGDMRHVACLQVPGGAHAPSSTSGRTRKRSVNLFRTGRRVVTSDGFIAKIVRLSKDEEQDRRRSTAAAEEKEEEEAAEGFLPLLELDVGGVGHRHGVPASLVTPILPRSPTDAWLNFIQWRGLLHQVAVRLPFVAQEDATANDSEAATRPNMMLSCAERKTPPNPHARMLDSKEETLEIAAAVRTSAQRPGQPFAAAADEATNSLLQGSLAARQRAVIMQTLSQQAERQRRAAELADLRQENATVKARLREEIALSDLFFHGLLSSV